MTNGRAPNLGNFFQKNFIRLKQLFDQVQFGVAVMDRDLRYVHVNDHMAVIDGIPADRHLLKSVGELDPLIASAIEPVLLGSINDGSSFVEHEVTVHRVLPDQSQESRYWLLCCYPLPTNDGMVAGCALIVKDATEQRIGEHFQVECMKIEALLSDLSTAFINVPVSEVDAKIELGLQRVVDHLGFDRCTIWHVAPDDGHLMLAHSYALPGITPPPTVIFDLIPVWHSMLLKGESFKVSDTDDMPDNCRLEKVYCKERGGIKSIMFIPARIGGVVVGTITFVSYTAKVEWPYERIQRLKLLWEIFANALERKRADQTIQDAMAEIKRLKDRLEAENLYLRDQIHIECHSEEIIGKSEVIQKTLTQVKRVAGTDSNVLILGETGTGKELIARAIHNLSTRKARAMIKVNCAALPATLIEAELFGHEKGAYTGAMSSQIGRFEAANGSTIFLDEIGEIPLELQSKLLRVLQEGQFERLGSPKLVEVDVRVIAATNRSLVQAVRDGKFREDLYYRLNVFPILVPPLRERSEDIGLLVWAMIEEFGKVFGKSIDRIPRKVMEAMERYPWPGNIRELRNLVERAMILSNGGTLVVDVPDNSAIAAPAMTMEGLERMHIVTVLDKTGWRIRGGNGAAEILGLKPTTLNSRMKKLGIKRKKSPLEASGHLDS